MEPHPLNGAIHDAVIRKVTCLSAAAVAGARMTLIVGSHLGHDQNAVRRDVPRPRAAQAVTS